MLGRFSLFGIERLFVSEAILPMLSKLSSNRFDFFYFEEISDSVQVLMDQKICFAIQKA